MALGSEAVMKQWGLMLLLLGLPLEGWMINIYGPDVAHKLDV